MILGDTCTRACGFCSVKTGKPTWNDPLEPLRVAQAVKKMGLRHVVITSVDRDDLKGDYGASIWADTIKQTKKFNLNFKGILTLKMLTNSMWDKRIAKEKTGEERTDNGEEIKNPKKI